MLQLLLLHRRCRREAALVVDDGQVVADNEIAERRTVDRLRASAFCSVVLLLMDAILRLTALYSHYLTCSVSLLSLSLSFLSGTAS